MRINFPLLVSNPVRRTIANHPPSGVLRWAPYKVTNQSVTKKNSAGMWLIQEQSGSQKSCNNKHVKAMNHTEILKNGVVLQR